VEITARRRIVRATSAKRLAAADTFAPRFNDRQGAGSQAVERADIVRRRGNPMEQALLKALAHFKILFKKEKGVPVDLEKLLGDAAYGRQVLAQAEDSGNEMLVVLALSIKDQLGYLKVVPPPPPAPVEAKAAPADRKKYMFGPRS
jgi:hypothetical protein